MSDQDSKANLWISRLRRFFSNISWISLIVGAAIGILIELTVRAVTQPPTSQTWASWELALGVVLGGIVGWVIPEFIQRVRFTWKISHPLRQVLGPFCRDNDPTVIFMSPLYPRDINCFVKNTNGEPGESMEVFPKSMEVFPKPNRPWVIAENDAKALGYVMSILAFSGKSKNVKIVRDDQGMEDTYDNLICIGGFVSNLKTGQINKVFQKLPLRFKWDGDEPVICAQEDGRTWKVDADFDYGILAKVPNEYNESSMVLIIAGVSHTGTAGAAHYLWRNWSDIPITSSQEPFALVIKVWRDDIKMTWLEYVAESPVSAKEDGGSNYKLY